MFGQTTSPLSGSIVLDRSKEQPGPGWSTNPAMQLFQSTTDEALNCLTEPVFTDEAVHAARKALRKARAALRMLRPLPNRVDRQACNHALRDAGRRLSTSRDARIVLDTLGLLVDKDYEVAARHAGEIAEFRRVLETRLRDARNNVARPDERRHCIALIEQSREWLEPGVFAGSNADALRDALLRIYGKACKAFVLSREMPTLESMHEWRKQTKCFRTAASVSRTTEISGLAGMAKRANHVAGCLGEDHDLALLLDAVQGGEQLSAKAARYLVHLIESRRAKLQHKAFAEGEELFGTKRRAQLTSTEQRLHDRDVAVSIATALPLVRQVSGRGPAQETRHRDDISRPNTANASIVRGISAA
jgi:CHAD domain-containing protein